MPWSTARADDRLHGRTLTARVARPLPEATLPRLRNSRSFDYDAAVRVPRVVLLLALVVPLMGNDCSLAARVGGPLPPPPPPSGGGDPPPPSGGGGIIIVTSGDRAPASAMAAKRVEPPLMASVLATSVATAPNASPRVASSVGLLASRSTLPPGPIDPASRAIASGSAFATPEPKASLLFLIGLALVASARGATRRRS